MRVKMKLTAKERKAGLDLRNFEVVKKKKFDLDSATHQEMSAYVQKMRWKLLTRNLTSERLRETIREFLDSKKKHTMQRARALSMVKYEVTIVREVEHRAVIEVEAESEDVAKQMAETIADNGNPYSNRWVEGDCLSQNIKVKVIS